MSAGFSKSKSRSQNQQEIVGGFEPILQQLSAILPQATGQFGQAFDAPQLDLSSLLPAIQSTLGPASAAFGTGLETGFAPDLTANLEAQLLPALERSFGRGQDAIREEAALRGTLSGTGTTQQVADLRGGLESGLLSQLAGAQTALAQGAQGVRAGLAQSGIGNVLNLIGQALEQSRFGATQPLAALGTVGGALSGIPTGQTGSSSSRSFSAQGGTSK